MLPADQRLEPADLAGLQVFLRLVVEQQLVAHDGVAQVVLQLQALQVVRLQVGLVEAEALLRFLGVVHRHVGRLQQRHGVLAVLGIDRNADAGAQQHLAAEEHERALQVVVDLLGDAAHHLVGAHAIQHDAELVAAEARHQVALAHAAGEALGDVLQQQVAGLVAQRVVDQLEVVEVEEQQRELLVLARGVGEQRLHVLVELGAVRPAGERVDVGELVHALLGAVDLQHVVDAPAQHRVVDRLADVVGRADAERLVDRGIVVQPGDQQDRDRGALGQAADHLAGLEAVHHRHHAVEDHEVRRLLAADLHGLLAVGRVDHLVALAEQRLAQREARAAVVVDHEDAEVALLLTASLDRHWRALVAARAAALEHVAHQVRFVDQRRDQVLAGAARAAARLVLELLRLVRQAAGAGVGRRALQRVGEANDLGHVLRAAGLAQLRDVAGEVLEEGGGHALDGGTDLLAQLREVGLVDHHVGDARAGRDAVVRERRFLVGGEPAVQHVAQHAELDRLREVVVHAHRVALVHRALLHVRRHRHDGHVAVRRVHGADAARGLEAVHARHVAVHQHQLVVLLREALERLDAVVGDGDFAAEALQHADRDFLVGAVVLDHENAAVAEAVARPGAFGARHETRRRRLVDEQRAQAVEQRRAAQRLAERLRDRQPREPVAVGARAHAEAHHVLRAAPERVDEGLGGRIDQALVDDRDVEANRGARERRGRGGDRVHRRELHALAGQHGGHRALHQRVVVAEQHAGLARQRQQRARLPAALARADERQFEVEPAAAAGDAVHRDLPAHQPHQFAADRQPQPRAAVTAGGGAVGLREGLEDLLLHRGVDAHARVGDLEAQPEVHAVFLDQRHRRADRAGFGELDRVAQQVQQHLPEVVHVAEHARRDVRVDDVGELQVLVLRLRGHQREGLLQLVAQVELDDFQRGLAGVDLGEGEDVVDQVQQHVGGAARGLHVVELLVAEVHVRDQVQHADHAVQRRAQLVAHGGRELALGARRFQRLVARDLERLALLDGLVARFLREPLLLERLVARLLRGAFLRERLVARVGDRLLATAQHLHHRVEGLLHVHDLARSFQRGAGVLLAFLGAAHDLGEIAHRHREARGDAEQHQQQHGRQHHGHGEARAHDLALHARQRLARHHQSHAADHLRRVGLGGAERRIAGGRPGEHRRREGPVPAVLRDQGRVLRHGDRGGARLAQRLAGVEPLAVGVQQLDAVDVGEVQETLHHFRRRARVFVEQRERALLRQRFDEPHALVLQAALHRFARLHRDHQARGDGEQQHARGKADADELLEAHRADHFSCSLHGRLLRSGT